MFGLHYYCFLTNAFCAHGDHQYLDNSDDQHVHHGLAWYEKRTKDCAWSAELPAVTVRYWPDCRMGLCSSSWKQKREHIQSVKESRTTTHEEQVKEKTWRPTRASSLKLPPAK